MNLKEILETEGCEALNDWLLLNFGQTLLEILNSIHDAEDAIANPEDYDEL